VKKETLAYNRIGYLDFGEEIMEIRATTAEMLSRINEGWEKLQNWLSTLTDEQLGDVTDAAGWTVKDHLMHLTIWEDGIEALLQKESRHKRMGLSDETWDKSDVDEINDTLRQPYKDKPLSEIRRLTNEIHQRLLATIGALGDDALNLPYTHYDADAGKDAPVFGWIVGNTYEHYAEHLPWMQSIAKKAD
jgi:hypothetical protein